MQIFKENAHFPRIACQVHQTSRINHLTWIVMIKVTINTLSIKNFQDLSTLSRILKIFDRKCINN